YRYAEERMMRVLGGWIALTPELPAKLLFGRHVWDCAQHADLWGRRLPELRAAAQQSAPANDAMVAFMEMLESPEGPRQTLERVVGVYAVLKPHLVTVYARHLGGTNAVYEPPTRRILARCLEEERRHAAAGAIVLDRLARGAAAWAEPAARDALTAVLAPLAGRITGTRVVGLAAIGRQRMVKVRIESPRAIGFVQLRWTPTASGWRIAAGDLVSTEPVSAAP